VASETLAVPAEWAAGAAAELELLFAAGAAWLAHAAGRLVAATAAAPPKNEVLRNFLRDSWQSVLDIFRHLSVLRLWVYTGARIERNEESDFAA